MKLFFGALLLVTGRAGATFVQVDNEDSRITWAPVSFQSTSACAGNASNDACAGYWWSESASNAYQGTYYDTWGTGTSFSFSFKGTSFMIYGVTFWAGAYADVAVDGTSVGSLNTVADGVIDPLYQQLLFMRSDLDGSQTHNVVVAYNEAASANSNSNRHWLGIDFVVWDETPESTSSSTSSSSASSSVTTTSSTTSLPSTKDTSKIGLFAAIGVLAALVLFLTSVIALLLRKRRLDHATATTLLRGPSPFIPVSHHLASPHQTLSSSLVGAHSISSSDGPLAAPFVVPQRSPHDPPSYSKGR